VIKVLTKERLLEAVNYSRAQGPTPIWTDPMKTDEWALTEDEYWYDNYDDECPCCVERYDASHVDEELWEEWKAEQYYREEESRSLFEIEHDAYLLSLSEEEPCDPSTQTLRSWPIGRSSAPPWRRGF